jgi:hypothetical protein
MPPEKGKWARILGKAAIAVLAGAALAACGGRTWVSSTRDRSTVQAARVSHADAPCRVLLKDTSQYGQAPMSASTAARIQSKWEAAQRLEWSGSTYLTFPACPPKRVLLIGDSLAFSLGLGSMIGEQRYDVELTNAAILACAFNTGGKIDHNGSPQKQPPACSTALSRWARIEHATRPQIVIVEMGHRDKFNWVIGGKVVHLGQQHFDRNVEREIDRYVQTLARGGAKVLLLSVPWSHPRALANGLSAPEASASRHGQINAMLQSAARRYPNRARYLDIDRVVSPGGRYRARVKGRLCRFDGIHFTIYCARLLQGPVFNTALAMVGG